MNLSKFHSTYLEELFQGKIVLEKFIQLLYPSRTLTKILPTCCQKFFWPDCQNCNLRIQRNFLRRNICWKTYSTSVTLSDTKQKFERFLSQCLWPGFQNCIMGVQRITLRKNNFFENSAFWITSGRWEKIYRLSGKIFSMRLSKFSSTYPEELFNEKNFLKSSFNFFILVGP